MSNVKTKIEDFDQSEVSEGDFGNLDEDYSVV